jgi:hypothetical protein
VRVRWTTGDGARRSRARIDAGWAANDAGRPGHVVGRNPLVHGGFASQSLEIAGKQSGVRPRSFYQSLLKVFLAERVARETLANRALHRTARTSKTRRR